MPASRWYSNLKELLEMIDQDDLDVEELFFASLLPQADQEKETASEEISSETELDESQIPTVLPIMPLRGLVVYPQTAVPLTIGQPRSIRLVDDVVASEERLIGLIASRLLPLEKFPDIKICFRLAQLPWCIVFSAPQTTRFAWLSRVYRVLDWGNSINWNHI